MIICIVYWINAIISPTCIVPLFTLWPPIHTISTAMQFMISIIIGIMKVIALFTNRFVFVRSRFAPSKRFSSYFSVLNARITGSPVSISRLTRFSRSTWFCTILNFGMTTTNSTITTITIRPTAMPIIQDISTFVLNTFQIPPIAMIGAYSTILRIMTVRSWICWISLVLLVISEAVENSSNSPLENPTTLRNTSLLKPFPTLAPTRDAISPTIMLATMPRAARASILAPVPRI